MVKWQAGSTCRLWTIWRGSFCTQGVRPSVRPSRLYAMRWLTSIPLSVYTVLTITHTWIETVEKWTTMFTLRTNCHDCCEVEYSTQSLFNLMSCLSPLRYPMVKCNDNNSNIVVIKTWLCPILAIHIIHNYIHRDEATTASHSRQHYS